MIACLCAHGRLGGPPQAGANTDCPDGSDLAGPCLIDNGGSRSEQKIIAAELKRSHAKANEDLLAMLRNLAIFSRSKNIRASFKQTYFIVISNSLSIFNENADCLSQSHSSLGELIKLFRLTIIFLRFRGRAYANQRNDSGGTKITRNTS